MTRSIAQISNDDQLSSSWPASANDTRVERSMPPTRRTRRPPRRRAPRNSRSARRPRRSTTSSSGISATPSWRSGRTRVLVAFDGWSSQWNEWVAKDSKRLRPPRGWGTAKKPDDWQAESTILALDMEGKWYPAKVLHVSELRVQVHYQRWSSKWDEWIDKDAGRLRKLDEPPGADEQEANEVGDERGCREDEAHLADDGGGGGSDCEEPGELVCCDGPCKRVFHEGCVPPNNPIESGSRWLCADCRTRRYRCFVCKKWGAARTELVMCPKKACGKWYHGECLQASLQPFSALEEEHRLAAADDGADDGADDDDGEAERAEEVWADESQWAQRPQKRARDFALASPTRAAAARRARRRQGLRVSSPERASGGTVRAVPTPRSGWRRRDPRGDGGAPRMQRRSRRRPPRSWGGRVLTRATGAPSAGRSSRTATARRWCIACAAHARTTARARCHGALEMITLLAPSARAAAATSNSPKGSTRPTPSPARPLVGRAAAVDRHGRRDGGAVCADEAQAQAGRLRASPRFDGGAAQPRDPAGPTTAQPVPYTPLKRTVYAHKRQRETLPESDESFCSCTPATGGCDERCQNRAMQQECTNATCACGAAAAECQFTMCTGDQNLRQLFKTEHDRRGRQDDARSSPAGAAAPAPAAVRRRRHVGGAEARALALRPPMMSPSSAAEMVDASRKGCCRASSTTRASPTSTSEVVGPSCHASASSRPRRHRRGPAAAADAVKWFGDARAAQRCETAAPPACTGYLGPAPRASRPTSSARRGRWRRQLSINVHPATPRHRRTVSRTTLRARTTD